MRILINKQNNDKFKFKKSFYLNRELYHFHFCRQADCFVRMLPIWGNILFISIWTIIKVYVNMQYLLQLYNCVLPYGLCYTKCGVFYNMCCGIQYGLCYTQCGVLYNMSCGIQYGLCYVQCGVLYMCCGIQNVMYYIIWVVVYNMCCVIQYVVTYIIGLCSTKCDVYWYIYISIHMCVHTAVVLFMDLSMEE